MAANTIKINGTNLYEWLCSTGHLLPSTELELNRFERLYPPGSISVNEDAVDPFAIINRTRHKRDLSISVMEIELEEQEQLRMAARNNGDLSDELLEQIKRNQQNKRKENGNGSGDKV